MPIALSITELRYLRVQFADTAVLKTDDGLAIIDELIHYRTAAAGQEPVEAIVNEELAAFVAVVGFLKGELRKSEMLLTTTFARVREALDAPDLWEVRVSNARAVLNARERK